MRDAQDVTIPPTWYLGVRDTGVAEIRRARRSVFRCQRGPMEVGAALPADRDLMVR